MLKTPIGRLRLVGMIEAVSYIALLGVGMPLKYVWGMPIATRITGSIHGLLFVLLCILLAQLHYGKGWPLKRSAMVFIAALLPFGPFVIDGKLKKLDEEEAAAT